jgi:hypothetical protein
MYLARTSRLLLHVIDDRWPDWARPQLMGAREMAVELADGVTPAAGPGRTLATELYDRWFSGAVAAEPVPQRPLVGAYRAAHADTATVYADGVHVLSRRDGVGADGWWRTWNTPWRPRRGDTRVLLSVRAAAVAELVHELTDRLCGAPYLLTCPTDPVRLTRSGAVVLYLARLRDLTPEAVHDLGPLLRPESPPLCLPVAPGVAVAQYPDNGMTFGEHRCHLLALALRGRRPSLAEIADVFAAHGVDPSTPYRN